MVGIILDTEKILKIATFLKLSENSAKIYLLMLNMGSGTLGQISLLSGLDPITTAASLDELGLRGLIKTVSTVVPRYYCLEPFIEAIIRSIDSEAYQTIAELIENHLKGVHLSVIDDLNLFQQYLSTSIESKKNEVLSTYTGKIDDDTWHVIEKILKDANNEIALNVFNIVKDIEERAKKQLSIVIKKEIYPIIAALEDAKSQLRLIFEGSREIITDVDLSSEILYSEPAVLSMMKDMIVRTKSNLIITMPKPELQSLIMVSEIITKKNVKITIAGDLDKVPKSILTKLSTPNITSSIQLKQSDEVKDWALIRDNTELLLAPDVPKTEKMLGIWILGSNPSSEEIIRQLSSQIRTVITHAKTIDIK